MAIDELMVKAGVDSRRLRRALALLGDGRWWTLADLVRETATSRRTVEALLRELPLERSGDRVRIPAEQAKPYNTAIQADISGHAVTTFPPSGVALPHDAAYGLADPTAHLIPGNEPVLKQLSGLIAGAPRGRQALDHVAATPETVLRRALLLGARFWLYGSRVICVGDHDLTSLAVKLIHPEADVMVVDIDDRILGYIAAASERLGLGVHTRWADLRLGLPSSAYGWADLAVTDPPYTPEGVGLFVARAAEGLRDREQGRVLLAYGASERTPALALKVQKSLFDLNLVNEAIFPDFNRYHGAEAIGSAADLYVLRPTTKTWPAVAARVDRQATAIYTHGPQSVESRPVESRPVESAPAAPVGLPQEQAAGAGQGPPGLLVGDWPKDLKTPRVRLATWLAKPHATDPERVAIAVPAGLEAALPRLLLATRAPHVRVHLTEPPAASLTSPLAPVYAFTAEGSVLHAVRLPHPGDEVGRVVRRILDNAHGKVANSWREGLVAAAGLTKRQARALVPEWAADVTVLELPVHRLRELPAAVAASLAAARS